jgi:hypothetical protein
VPLQIFPFFPHDLFGWEPCGHAAASDPPALNNPLILCRILKKRFPATAGADIYFFFGGLRVAESGLAFFATAGRNLPIGFLVRSFGVGTN